MYRQYIRRNITSVSIILFIAIFCIIQLVEPACIYEKDGSLRQFGLGKIKMDQVEELSTRKKEFLLMILWQLKNILN